MPGRKHPLIGTNRQTYIVKMPEKLDQAPGVPEPDMCNYARAIIDHGGLPVLIPFLDDEARLAEYVERVDGIVLTGGADYPPEWYGCEPDPKFRTVGEARAKNDRILVRLALDSGKPVLGICAGLQLANIHLGGGLVMDISPGVEHRASEAGDAYHEVDVVPGTLAARILGAGRGQVNSSHHQAADPERLGAGLVVTARSVEDGIIEALEPARDEGVFRLFVQWHPERIRDLGHRKSIFRAFIDACCDDGRP